MTDYIRYQGEDDSGDLDIKLVQVTDNAENIRHASDFRGNYPSTLVSAVEFTAGAAGNDVLYTSADISMYNYHVIENTDVSVPLAVYVSLDGTNFNATPVAVELLDDVTTGGGIKAVSIETLKVGVLKGKFMKIKCLQVGAGTCDGRILHGVV